MKGKNESGGIGAQDRLIGGIDTLSKKKKLNGAAAAAALDKRMSIKRETKGMRSKSLRTEAGLWRQNRRPFWAVYPEKKSRRNLAKLEF